MTDKIEALREKLHDTLSLIGAYGSVDMHLWDKHCDAVLKSMDALSDLDRLRSENEAMRKALEWARNRFDAIIIDCQGASVCGEPEMGLEAIYHRASDAIPEIEDALSTLQEEEAR